MQSAAGYVSPGPGAPLNGANTSLALNTTDSVRGSVRKCMPPFICARVHLISKKNRNPTSRSWQVDGVTLLLII